MKPISDNQLAYSIEQLARVTSLSPMTIRSEIREGKLRAKRIGKRFIITAEAVDEWLAS